jgi:hypothetical protein
LCIGTQPVPVDTLALIADYYNPLKKVPSVFKYDGCTRHDIFLVLQSGARPKGRRAAGLRPPREIEIKKRKTNPVDTTIS